MKKVLAIGCVVVILFSFLSLSACGGGGLSGTYVPVKTDSTGFGISKLVFSDKKVSITEMGFTVPIHTKLQIMK